MVLQALANRVSVPKRVRTILAELRTRLKSRRTGESERLSVLKQELDKVQAGMDRLLEAVESGYLPLDGSLQDRVHRHQTRRQDILLEMGAMRREAELPLNTIGASQIDAFSRVLRGKLLGEKAFAKQYLRTLVTEIRVDGAYVRVTGSNAALAQAVAQTKTDTRAGVPTFAPDWLPDQGSNLGPAD